MKNNTIIILVVLCTLVIIPNLFSQQSGTITSNPLRLDLRALGHPPLDVIPPGECAITSLVVGEDGCIYGGTSGTRAHLFQLDPKWGHVFPLGYLEGQESIFHSIVSGPDSSIYIGTSFRDSLRIGRRSPCL